MCATSYSSRSSGAASCLGYALVDFARRNVDARVHVALPQLAQDHLLADFLAISPVVDALRLERRGQVAELDVVAGCDLGECLVELLVGHLDAGSFGALHLYFLQHEPLEHLLPEDVPRWQLLARLLQAHRDELHLLVERTLQDDAVVHDRDDSVQRYAACCGRRIGAGGWRNGRGTRPAGCGQVALDGHRRRRAEYRFGLLRPCGCTHAGEQQQASKKTLVNQWHLRAFARQGARSIHESRPAGKPRCPLRHWTGP